MFEKGREHLGKEFIISDYNTEKIINIIKYLSGNGGYDNRKGIYLFGQFGVGKTTFMNILNYVFSELPPFGVDGRRLNLNGFGSISIEKIIEHHKSHGNIDKFIQKRNLCIHEFGKKVNEKIYGTDANSIIEALFMLRYELYQDGYLTHVTGNYHPSEVIMPDIIKSRMVEMFNFIEFKGKSFRI